MAGIGARSLALALLLTLTLACQGEEARIAEHLTRADAYFEEGRYAEAILEYESVLQIEPRHAAAQYRLANCFLATRDLSSAYSALENSVVLDPRNLEAKLMYGLLLVAGGEAEEGLRQAEEVLARNAVFPGAHLIQARALEALDRSEAARESLERGLRVPSNRASALLLLARFHLQRGERASAEPLLRRLIEVEPSYSAYAALAGFLAEDGARDDEAEAAYRELPTRAKQDEQTHAHRALASFYYSRQRFAEAASTLEAAVEEAPDDMDLLYALARAYRAGGTPAQAEAALERATVEKPGEPLPRLLLALNRAQDGDLAGALEAAEAAIQVAPAKWAAQLLKAELLIDLGARDGLPERIAEGERLVAAVLEENPSSPEALFAQAKIDLAKGRVEEAVVGLRRVVALRPNGPRAYLALGSALLRQSQPQRAKLELGRALEIDPGLTEARRLLMRAHASVGENDLVLQEATRVLREEPQDPATRILAAQSLIRLRRPAEALATLEMIPEQHRDAEVLYALGLTYRFQGQLEQAREHFVRADAAQPHRPEILRALLELDRREGRRPEESLERLEAAVEAEPRNAEFAHLQGLARLRAGRSREAEASLRRAIELDPDQIDYHRTLAKYLAVSGRNAEVVEAYEQALAARPDSAELHFTVASLYQASGAWDRALQHYEEAIRLNPSSAAAKNNLAQLLAESGGGLDRALALAQEAKALWPESADVADTLGWVLYKKGIPSAAIAEFRQVEASLDPEDPNLGVARYRLALAYQADGQSAKAREVLKAALATQDALREVSPAGTPAPDWEAKARAMLDRLKRFRSLSTKK